MTGIRDYNGSGIRLNACRAKAKTFRDMRFRNPVGIGQIRHRSRNPEYSMAGPRGKREPAGRHPEKVHRPGTDPDPPGETARGQPGIQAAAGYLTLPGRSHPQANGGAGFAPIGIVRQEFRSRPCHFDAQVDAIQERTRNAGAVPPDLLGRASARPHGIAEVTAGAGIHGGHQLELRGPEHPSRHPGYGDGAIFQGFSQPFQNATVELGQLVQEQNAAMSQ